MATMLIDLERSVQEWADARRCAIEAVGPQAKTAWERLANAEAALAKEAAQLRRGYAQLQSGGRDNGHDPS
jgi:hypothetical protein